MKPVGLRNPHDGGRRPHAVVQLRQDNALGTLYNMVGFQTKLKHAEQVRMFRTIPGLESAEFARLGGLHRNTFVNSPEAARPRRCGCGRRRASGWPDRSPAARATSRVPRSACWPGGSPRPSGWARSRCRRPATTAIGALLRHLTGGALQRDVPADERQLRAVPAARPPAAGNRRAAPRPQAGTSARAPRELAGVDRRPPAGRGGRLGARRPDAGRLAGGLRAASTTHG